MPFGPLISHEGFCFNSGESFHKCAAGAHACTIMPCFLALSHRYLTAFVPPNDLLFLEALQRSRPELARLPRPRLERRLRRNLAGRPVRYRLGAPYTEHAEDLSRFTRPDLLKALLLLEALDRPEVRQRISERW